MCKVATPEFNRVASAMKSAKKISLSASDGERSREVGYLLLDDRGHNPDQNFFCLVLRFPTRLGFADTSASCFVQSSADSTRLTEIQ
jgi:hypothetical protein